ncbi:MAG: AMP-binding protein [Ectothiorhodospiraceae bacterium]|nr:AMP-binding protein [Ectothiorhodospiraceae bacterium]
MTNDQFVLRKIFKNALTKYGNKPAVVFQGKHLTYSELFRQSCIAAHALVNKRVTANTRVALMMSNCLEYAIADQAIIQAGATKVPLNDMLGAKEINYIIKDSQARVVFVGKNFFDVVQTHRNEWPDLETIVGIARKDECPDGFLSWEEFVSGENMEPPDVQVCDEDLGLIAYTGGTTGMPKGVMHSQKSMALNMFSHLMELGYLDDERVLLASPLPHAAGYMLLAGLLKGATHFVESGFDPDTVISRVQEERITATLLVPTMIYRLLDRISETKAELHSLRTVLYGAAPITEERLRQGLELLGPVFMQAYGQTEIPNMVTRLRKEDHRTDEAVAHRLRSCGQPVTMVDVRIVDGTGKEVPRGESGELAVRAPYAMLGYHGLPDKTRETIVDGWVMTGDIARQDADSYIYLLDRSKDMIITGGMNVYTTEVENAVQGCPGVSQVAVVGLPHPDWGEAVTAFIVKEKGHPVTAEDVIAHCRNELSSYKRPKLVKFIESLPLTVYGKPDKKRLRAMADDNPGQ